MCSYTPAQTVGLSGFSIETLRYYERIGLLGKVERNSSGRRVFTESDLAWLDALRCLRDTGMPIATMRRYADLALTDSADTIPDRLALMEEHDRAVTARIDLLLKQQQHLHEKITHYQYLLSV